MSHLEPKQSLSPRQWVALITLLALVVASAFGNYFLAKHFIVAPGSPPLFFLLSLGLLLAQPCLLSIWCAMGSGRTLWRVLASMGIKVGLTLVYFKAFDGNRTLPIEIMGMMIGIVVVLSLIVQLPLWLYRKFTKHSIRLQNQLQADSNSNQFAIKHLLIAMTAVAVIVAATKAIIPDVNMGLNSGPPSWVPVIWFLTFFIVTISLLSFLVLASVFSTNRRKPFVIMLALFFFAAPYAAVLMMTSSSLVPGGVWSWKETLNTYKFIWSVGFGLIAVLSLFYLIGFRLKKDPV